MGTFWTLPKQKTCFSRQASVDDSILQGLETSTSQAVVATSVAPVIIDVEVPQGDDVVQGGDNGQWSDGNQDQGQWEWKPPVTTTTETTFLETSQVKEPISGDYKVVCCKYLNCEKV